MKPFPDGFYETVLNPRSSKLQYEDQIYFFKKQLCCAELMFAKLKWAICRNKRIAACGGICNFKLLAGVSRL